jgi:hypothetical protein
VLARVREIGATELASATSANAERIFPRMAAFARDTAAA